MQKHDHEVDKNRVGYARERACVLSREKKKIHYAVRVGGIYGPTTRERGWSECFGIFEGGKEVSVR